MSLSETCRGFQWWPRRFLIEKGKMQGLRFGLNMVFLSRSLVPILHRWDVFVPMKSGSSPHVCYVEWWLWNVQVPWQPHVRRSFWSNETNETRLRQFGFSWPKNVRIGTLEVARVFLVEVAGNEKWWKLVSKKKLKGPRFQFGFVTCSFEMRHGWRTGCMDINLWCSYC